MAPPLPPESLLSSAAKLKVLEALHHNRTGLRLRQLASVTELPIRSIQVAVASLLKAKVIRATRVANAKLFSLNLDHRLHPLIVDICQALERQRIRDGHDVVTSASDFTAFNSQALQMIQSARPRD